MKYIQERTTFLRSDNLKKGDILVSKIIEYMQNNLTKPNTFFDNEGRMREDHRLFLNDKIYFFECVGGMVSDDYFLKIYNVKDVADITYPNYYKNPISSKYEISKKMFNNFHKVGKLENVKINQIEIPEKFLQDEKFMNDLNELSVEYIAAFKYNL
jgi:hypothetical protein